MKKFLFLFILPALFTLGACNKDQRTVKKIAGTWTLDRATVDGVDITSNTTVKSYEFEECKLKKDEWCNLRVTYTDGSYTDEKYKVKGDGEEMVIDLISSQAILNVTIEKREKNELDIAWFDNGSRFTAEMSR